MTRLFANRVTEAGRQAIEEAIDYVAQEWKRATEAHGENSPQAAQCLLAFISIDQIIEPREDAHPHIERYLAISEKIYGRKSLETANGFLILGWSHAGLERGAEAEPAFRQSSEQPGGKRDFPPLEPMLEALCDLLDKLQDDPKPEHARLPLVLGVHTLSWLVTYCPIQSHSFRVFLERLRPVFESWGFTGDTWEWLMRRCHRLYNYTAGLISVLIEERLVTAAPDESKESNETGSEDNAFVKGYAISGIKREHWTSPEGFSKTFPVCVAEGELSLRVERLLAEGCRCLSTTDDLGTVFLIFSSHWVGRRITAFGTTTWSDEEKVLLENQVRETIGNLGADSAMLLTWVELRHEESDESDDELPEAVMVIARDEKSYLRGLQPARKIDGKYVFDQPMVRVTEDTWFSEFAFPVEPAEKPGRTKEEAEGPQRDRDKEQESSMQSTEQRMKSDRTTL